MAEAIEPLYSACGSRDCGGLDRLDATPILVFARRRTLKAVGSEVHTTKSGGAALKCLIEQTPSQDVAGTFARGNDP